MTEHKPTCDLCKRRNLSRVFFRQIGGEWLCAECWQGQVGEKAIG